MRCHSKFYMLDILSDFNGSDEMHIRANWFGIQYFYFEFGPNESSM
jgi:hypothetical protein